MGMRPQKTPSADSQITQDVIEQTEMIFQDVHENTMQAYIKYKAYYDKKKPMHQNSGKQITITYYNQKLITKD